MRLLALLNRRYTLRQTAMILLPSLVVLLVTQTGATAIGISRPLAATFSLIAALGSYFVLAALIDRRTRRG